jgi:hypothetical protein
LDDVLFSQSLTALIGLSYLGAANPGVENVNVGLGQVYVG